MSRRRSKGELCARGALLSLLAGSTATLASCGAAPPLQVTPSRAALSLTVRVIDVDPLVVADCQTALIASLERHGFAPALKEGVDEASSPITTEIEVAFPDGVTSDMTATLHDSLPYRRVLASSVTPYYTPPQTDLRSLGGRFRTQSCAVAAERLAVALVRAIGEDDGKESLPASAFSTLHLTYRDLAAPAREPPPERGAVLPAASVKSDLDRLVYALDRGYGGRGFVPDAAWSSMLADLAAIPRKGTTVEALCDAVGDALWKLPDAHLSARRRPGKDEGTADITCGRARRAAERRPSVGPNHISDQPDLPWDHETSAVGHATFGILGVQRFPLHDDPAWSRFPKALDELASTDGLVIDLRGSTGGDAGRGYELAAKLLDGPVSSKAVRVHERRTPESLTLLLNTYSVLNRRPDGTFDPLLEKRYREVEKGRDAAALSKGPEWRVENNKDPGGKPGANAYSGNITVLVDASCASACETTLDALRLHPRVRVLGERTSGMAQFGDPGRLMLPASWIEVRIPTKYNQYSDGHLLDKTGIAPDVALPPGTDAFAAAMDWHIAHTPSTKIVPSSDYVLPDAVREAERARLASLGLSLPSGSPVLEKPFAAPYSRRSFVVPQSFLPHGPPRRVYAPALLSDLDALQEVMSRAYGGYRSAEALGWDWSKRFAGWRARLRAAGPAWMPLKEAFQEVKDLQATQRDNHTTIPLGLRFGGTSRTWVLATGPQGACDSVRDKTGHEHPIPKKDPAFAVKEARAFDGLVFSKGHYLVRPTNHEDLTAVQCGGAWIPVRPASLPTETGSAAALKSLSDQPEDRPLLRRLGDEIAYLRLPTFGKDTSEIITRERPTWPRPTGKEKILVVDLRDNYGGDAAVETLEGWADKRDLDDAQTVTKHVGASCLYPALRWGYTMISSLDLTPPITSEMRADLQTGLDDLFKEDAPDCPAKFDDHRAKRSYHDKATPKSPRRGHPRILAIVNDQCASDCEYMATILQKLPGTVIAGVNTMGVHQFIQPGYSILPNTRLPFRVALGTSDSYGDGRSTDGFGLDVDVLLDGEAAWTKDGVLALVKELSKP